MRRTTGLLAFGTALVTVALVLTRTFEHSLATPPPAGGPGHDGLLVTGWLLAILATAAVLVAWLLIATVLQLLAEGLPIAPAALRAAGCGAVGVTATLSLAITSPGPSPLVATESPALEVDGRATLVPLDSPTDGPTASLVPLPPDPVVQPVAVPAAPAPSGELVVRRGEDFWTLADGVVSQALGRAATDREIAGYWVRLIDANRDRLVVAGVPDLIYAGQVFRRPPVDPGRTELPSTR